MRSAHNHYMGNNFHIHKGFAGGFSAGGNLVFPLCYGLIGPADYLSPPLDGYDSQSRVYFCCGGPLWNLLILPFGEYRPYLYDGFKCRCYYFSCTILYGDFKPSVFERRRKVTGKFLYWFRCCNDRDIPD